jgi:hypothetical protein
MTERVARRTSSTIARSTRQQRTAQPRLLDRHADLEAVRAAPRSTSVLLPIHRLARSSGQAGAGDPVARIVVPLPAARRELNRTPVPKDGRKGAAVGKDRVGRDDVDGDLDRRYLTDIGQYPLLRKEDEVRLAKALEAAKAAIDTLAAGGSSVTRRVEPARDRRSGLKVAHRASAPSDTSPLARGRTERQLGTVDFCGRAVGVSWPASGTTGAGRCRCSPRVKRAHDAGWKVNDSKGATSGAPRSPGIVMPIPT